MVKKIRSRIGRYLRGAARRIDPSAPKPAGSPAAGYAKTDPFFDCLVRLGFKPRSIVDVGANRGNWTRTAMRYFPEAKYYLFEPQRDLLAESDLQRDARVKIFAVGVGAANATMKLSKHEKDHSFSFALSEEQASEQGREQVDAPVVALDEFLTSQCIAYPEMLKIDAEGWDLEVVNGGENTVANAEIVLLEAAVTCHAFRNTVESVVLGMSARGFQLFDITDLNRPLPHGALWLVELAFAKKGGRLMKAVEENSALYACLG